MLMQVHLVISLLVAVAFGEPRDMQYRLSNHILPSSYWLSLNIDDLNKTSFSDQKAEITFRTLRDNLKALTLHAHKDYIDITNVKINYPGSGDFDCTTKLSTKYNEAVDITCRRVFTPNSNYILTITYDIKKISEDMEGLYKSTYDDGKMLLATQFEPTHARKVFPCFDEPSFKATFRLTITHPSEYQALSNTAASSSPLTGNAKYTTTTFEQTPEMSTYLLAFIISQFKGSQKLNESADFNYNVYARDSAQGYLKTAMEYGPKLIKTMGAFTGINYNTLGNKQAYQVAIPDFAAGAMENWGLITYREADLLDEGNITSKANKQKIITVIAHELSHQWFGDYVTMGWWADLWLNEGFAAYFENHLPSKDLKFDDSEEFELEKQFISVFQAALKADAESGSHPLFVPYRSINTFNEISQRFDAITYSKGASIVRMMKYVLGDKFKEALTAYFKTDPRIVSSDTLITNLDDSADEQQKFNWTNWIKTSGYPLVTASLNETRLIFTQESVQNDSEIWSIPLTYTTKKDKDFDFKIKKVFDDELLEVENVNTESWIIANVKGIGFYRVNYDDELWNRIVEGLNEEHEKIDVLNRAQLIDDIYNLAKMGHVDYKKALALTDYLKNEKEYYPWLTALNEFDFLLSHLDDDNKKTLQELIRGYIELAFKDEKYEKHVGTLKKVLIENWSCRLGDEACLANANNDFQKYLTKKSAIETDRRGNVLCYGLQQSAKQEEDYNKLFGNFQASKSSLEQNDILGALGCVTDHKRLMKYLQDAMDEKKGIRKQDAAKSFISVYSKSEKGLDAVLEFLTTPSNFEKFNDRCKGLNSVTTVVKGLANVVRTEAQGKKLKKLINDQKANEEIISISEQVHNILDKNKKWSSDNKDSIKAGISSLTPSVNPGAGVAFTPMLLSISIISLITLMMNVF